MEDYLTRLNPQQLEIVTSSEPRIVCMAGAGTGKTHTLISRLKYLTEERQVDPRSILVLTFTRAAANEFESRYRNISRGFDTPDFYTFHSFCYNLILNNNVIRAKLGYKFDPPSVISDSEQRTLWRQVELEFNLNLTQEQRAWDYIPKDFEKFKVEAAKKAFNKLLISRNKITFDKMCFEVCDLFKTKDQSISYLVDQYKYIFVDEFQDTDPYQWEFVSSFEDSASLFVVGDLRQCLYRFRNADSEIMKNLVDSSDWKTYKLEMNYRSSIQICNNANKLLERFKMFDNLENLKLVGQFEGENVSDIYIEDFRELIEHSSNPFPEDTAILCRTNKNVDHIQKLLVNNSIKYRTKFQTDDSLFWKAALDPEFYYEYMLTKCVAEDQLKFMARSKIATRDIVLYELELKLPDIADKVREIKQEPKFEEYKQLYYSNSLDLAQFADVHRDDNHGVYVGTIHSVKGLEFDTVYVYNPGGSSFILTDEDNLNCYYVACTRPKRKLVNIIANI